MRGIEKIFAFLSTKRHLLARIEHLENEVAGSIRLEEHDQRVISNEMRIDYLEAEQKNLLEQLKRLIPEEDILHVGLTADGQPVGGALSVKPYGTNDSANYQGAIAENKQTVLLGPVTLPRHTDVQPRESKGE